MNRKSFIEQDTRKSNFLRKLFPLLIASLLIGHEKLSCQALNKNYCWFHKLKWRKLCTSNHWIKHFRWFGRSCADNWKTLISFSAKLNWFQLISLQEKLVTLNKVSCVYETEFLIPARSPTQTVDGFKISSHPIECSHHQHPRKFIALDSSSPCRLEREENCWHFLWFFMPEQIIEERQGGWKIRLIGNHSCSSEHRISPSLANYFVLVVTLCAS